MPFYVGSTGDQRDVIEVDDLTQCEIETETKRKRILTFSFNSNLGYFNHQYDRMLLVRSPISLFDSLELCPLRSASVASVS